VSHTDPPVHLVALLAEQITHVLLAEHAGVPLAQRVALLAVQATQAPVLVLHTWVELHCASAVQPTHTLPVHTGLFPVQRACEALVHSTHSFEPEHTGSAVVQSERSDAVHSTQAPEVAHARLFGQLLPLQATHETPSQIGVLPLH
jgi:hypothetical protein